MPAGLTAEGPGFTVTPVSTTSLSVLVPVFDEQHLVAASLARLEVLRDSPHLDRVQVIVLDDSSRDATPEVLRAFAAERGITLAPPSPSAPRGRTAPGAALRGSGRHGGIEWLFLRHERNGGKGAAVRSALAHADCELSVIHDADLEYHPRDLLRIVKVFVEEGADAVFGSRFAGGEARRALLFRHELGNRLLTFLTNLITNVNLTDMETCYKAVRTSLLKSIPIVSNDFRLEPELTIKLAKREARIFEVPISYAGRTYQEGKKIGWRDGFRALGAMLRFWMSDELYVQDARRPLQHLDGGHRSTVLRPPGPRDRERHRKPHSAPRAPRRLRRLRREPALPPDAPRAHLRSPVPRSDPHRRDARRLLPGGARRVRHGRVPERPRARV